MRESQSRTSSNMVRTLGVSTSPIVPSGIQIYQFVPPPVVSFERGISGFRLNQKPGRANRKGGGGGICQEEVQVSVRHTVVSPLEGLRFPPGSSKKNNQIKDGISPLFFLVQKARQEPESSRKIRTRVITSVRDIDCSIRTSKTTKV